MFLPCLRSSSGRQGLNAAVRVPQGNALSCEVLLELSPHILSTLDHDASISWWACALCMPLRYMLGPHRLTHDMVELPFISARASSPSSLCRCPHQRDHSLLTRGMPYCSMSQRSENCQKQVTSESSLQARFRCWPGAVTVVAAWVPDCDRSTSGVVVHRAKQWRW